jgi:hypothetical protein
VRVDVGIFQFEPWTVSSVQAHGRAGTLVLAMIFSKTPTTLFRATSQNGRFYGHQTSYEKALFMSMQKETLNTSHKYFSF